MTVLTAFRCDRCKKIENLTEKDRLNLQIIKGHDLCEDCNMIITFVMFDKHRKIVDEAIDLFFEEKKD